MQCLTGTRFHTLDDWLDFFLGNGLRMVLARMMRVYRMSTPPAFWRLVFKSLLIDYCLLIHGNTVVKKKRLLSIEHESRKSNLQSWWEDQS